MSNNLKNQPRGVQRFYRAWNRLAKHYNWNFGGGRRNRQCQLLSLAWGTYEAQLADAEYRIATEYALQFIANPSHHDVVAYVNHPLVIKAAEKDTFQLPMSDLDDLVLEETTYF